MSKGRRVRKASIILGVTVALIAAVIVLWDWNWFRGIAAAQASAALGRPVTIGSLDVKLFGRPPVVILGGLVIGNPKDAPAPQPLLSVDRLEVAFDLNKLFHRTLRFPEITVDGPHAWAQLNDDGRANWMFGDPNKPASAPSQSFPEIGRLTINNGDARFIDPKLKADLTLKIHTDPSKSADEPEIAIDGTGKYNGADAKMMFRGSSILSLEDQAKPYALDASANFGPVTTKLKGSVTRPFEMSGFKFDFYLAGPDLAGLYPLTGVALPPTPPYVLEGELTFVGHAYRFSKFKGKLGDSDLAGDLTFEPAHDDVKQPKLTGDLTSEKVVLADLRGFTGAAPGKADAPNATPERKAQAAQEASTGRVLPDVPFNLEKLRSMDADVKYRGKQIMSDSTPIDNFEANIKLENGHLALTPVKLGVGTGTIAITGTLDGSVNPPKVDVSADFRHVDLKRIMKNAGGFNGFGTIGGSAQLQSAGNSVAQLLGRGDGELKLFMTGGEISQILTAFGRVDLMHALGLGTGIEKADKPNGDTAIRCMADDMILKSGVMNVKVFVLDTRPTTFELSGSANLADETLDLKMTPHPKESSVLAFRPPILIKGTLGSPSIYPEPIETGARVAATVVLGIVATPLGALIPSIELGLGKDADCDNLVKAAQQTAQPQRPPASTQKRQARKTPAAPSYEGSSGTTP